MANLLRYEDLILDIYARVSRLSDARARSTAGQVTDCTGRVEDLGAGVGEVWVDPGRSAWNPKVKRLEWHKLMARLEARATGGVIVFDLSRFSRRPVEGEQLIKLAERGLVVLDSEGEYDLTSASGKKNFRDQMNSAAFYSDRLSTIVRRGKKQRARAGESNHSHRPFGFELDGQTPREPEASELRSLTARLLAGETVLDLIEDLNSRGVLTAEGRPWTSLRHTLTRPCNAGLVGYKDEFVVEMKMKDGLEPLVAREDWEQVIAIFAGRRRGRPTTEQYLFSTLIHCGLCGHPLNGRTKSQHKPYADGAVQRIYYCQKRRDGYRGGCGGVSGDQREIDAHAETLIVAVLADPHHAAAVEEAARQLSSRRRDVRAKLTELERTVETIAGRLGREEITLERHDATVLPLDRRIAELRRELKDLPEESRREVTPKEAARSLAAWQERWARSGWEERRTLAKQALRAGRLLLMPADPGGSQEFDPTRLVWDEGRSV